MSSKPSKALLLPADYAQWLAGLKSQIAGARQRAVLSANQEQIRLYHRIGAEILERQQRQGWGAKVIARLSSDLQEAFPDMKGFSTRNLKYMQYFAEQCPSGLIGQQSAAQLPWFHSAVDSQINASDDKPTRKKKGGVA
jgi:predicted nuclease of restriction endonuclease-like (RecB) superfamily